MRSRTSAVITAVNAVPMTTATARSTRFPRRMKARNSLRIPGIGGMRGEATATTGGTLAPAMDLSLFFAGTAGSVPTARRGMPALLLRRGGEKLLFDCGEGTQRQLVRSVGLPEVDQILLTHFHADHWLGLPGMLKTFDLRDRERPLTVRGPRGLRELMKMMRVVYGRVRYELTVEELEPGTELRGDGYTLAAVAVQHRVPALAWVLWEDERPGHLDAAAAERLGVAPGPAFGRL